MWEKGPEITESIEPELPKASPKRKPEGEHTTALIKGIQALGGFAYKIPDPVGSFKTAPRPFDVMACFRGRSIAIECKWMKAPKAFGIRELRDVQVNGLTTHMHAGGTSLVVLFTKHTGRIHAVTFEWREMSTRKESYKKAHIVRMIENGETATKKGDAFELAWWFKKYASRRLHALAR